MDEGNKNRPLLSVVVPVYNAERYLKDTIESLIRQTLDEIEIILVDDGSSDASPEICDRAVSAYKRVKTVHQNHFGVSRARNAGVAAANGDYIGFCDSDDNPDFDLYETLYRLITANNCDIACVRTSAGLPNSDGGNVPDGKITLFRDKKELLKSFLIYKIPVSVCSKLLRRDLAEKISFDESVKMNEDRLYTFSAIEKCGGFVYENRVRYDYLRRKKPANEIKDAAEKYADIVRVSEKIKEKINTNYPDLTEYAQAASAIADIRFTQLLYINNLDKIGHETLDASLKRLRSADLRLCGRYLSKDLYIKLLLAKSGFLYKPAVRLFSKR